MFTTYNYSIPECECGVLLNFDPVFSVNPNDATIVPTGASANVPNIQTYYVNFITDSVLPSSQVTVTLSPDSYTISNTKLFIPQVSAKIVSVHNGESQSLIRVNVKDVYNNVLFNDYVKVICSPTNSIVREGYYTSNTGPNGGIILSVSTTDLSEGMIVKDLSELTRLGDSTTILDIRSDSSLELSIKSIEDLPASTKAINFSFSNSLGCFLPVDNPPEYIYLNSGNNWTYRFNDKTIAKFVKVFDDDIVEIRLPIKNKSKLPGRTKKHDIPDVAMLKINDAVALVTLTPTVTRTATPTPTQTRTPTKTPTRTPTNTPTPSPTVTDSPTPTPTVTDSPTPTPTVTDSPTPTPTITVSSTPTLTPTPSSTVTDTPTPTPTVTDSPTPTPTITCTPTRTVTPTPTLTPTTSAPIYLQLGSSIPGDSIELFGMSVSINSSGHTIAVGAPNYDEGSGEIGQVRIYDWNGTSWAQKGADINGSYTSLGLGEEYGYSIAINNSGNIVAIGAPQWLNGYRGRVGVYEWNGSSWNIMGNHVSGIYTNDNLGYSVAINSSGNIFCVNMSRDSGIAQVYQWTGASPWNQMGSDILNDNISPCYDIDINGSGNIFVAGIGSDDTVAPNAGAVKVYKWDGSSWNLMGSPIYGTLTNERLGNGSVAINDSGNIIAAASTGTTSIYQWDGSSWNIMGQPLPIGTINNEVSLSLNPIGHILGFHRSGITRIYKWDGFNWNIFANHTIGTSGSAQFPSMDINDNGNIYCVGNAELNSNSGVAMIFYKYPVDY